MPPFLIRKQSKDRCRQLYNPLCPPENKTVDYLVLTKEQGGGIINPTKKLGFLAEGRRALIISTRGRYGLRAMFELAKAHGEGTLSIKQIAAAQGLSEQYLEQIFARLKNAGLVDSTRGAGGGYSLSAVPSDITVGRILVALEGELSPAECVGEDASACKNKSVCTTHAIWQRIYDGFNGVVNGITLQDMLDDYHRMGEARPDAKDIRC